ncbi:hypothetical protein BHE74_00004032 [Ensete ventricosum]|uniref:Uncharacterized protein n=1 Tax=Ensete ventricosum TaxID=4639 RepID=A0A444GIA3_ENSVE|nr:hypothetical protein B296_00000456 [Ensete ventricosum]RWW34626.1 hypothetical protein GW17_00000582 [Ensete ventricosum]RWW87147.1 hypothetical protein BHE74_00004032 [Ensete ventricosum]
MIGFGPGRVRSELEAFGKGKRGGSVHLEDDDDTPSPPSAAELPRTCSLAIWNARRLSSLYLWRLRRRDGPFRRQMPFFLRRPLVPRPPLSEIVDSPSALS